jgi:hypothetical protein
LNPKKIGLLPRRKDKRPATKQMNMQMKNCLTPISICVDYDAISVSRDARLSGDIARGKKQMPKHRLFRLGGRIERVEMFARHYQQVRRSLRVNVIKSYTDIVFVNPGGLNITHNYLAKKAIAGHIECDYYTTNGQDC